MSRIAMIVMSTAAAGKRDELYDLYMEQLAPRAEANEAQEVVVWCADNQDEDRFALFEVYANAEAMGQNAQSTWFAEYLQDAMPLLAGEPTVIMAESRWSTGL
ncbi:MAG: hypothetical protein AAGA99_03145 [Actinomycetota bacterium]